MTYDGNFNGFDPNMYNTPSYTPVMTNATASTAGSPNDGESKTGAQVAFYNMQGVLRHASLYTGNRYLDKPVLNIEKMRAMRRDPTIGLARSVNVLPMITPQWVAEPSDESAEPEWVDYVERYIVPLRSQFVRPAAFGNVDYGWRAFEVVYDEVFDEALGQRVVPVQLKVLRPEVTWIRRNAQGKFIGFLTEDLNHHTWYYVDKTHALLINYDEEGTGDYGDPLMARAEGPYDEWNTANDTTKRFSEKMAGSMWVLHYPTGRSMFRGTLTDNEQIADTVLQEIRASGNIRLPSKLGLNAEQELLESGQPGWKLELMETGNKAVDFVPHLSYLDKLKARALNVLERTMLEGQYGTKAESGEHTDVMIAIGLERLGWALDMFNKQITDYMLEVNYNALGAVDVKPQAMTDEERDRIQAIIGDLLANPQISEQVVERVSVPDVLDTLGVPVLSDEEIEQNLQRDVMQVFNTGAPIGVPQQATPVTPINRPSSPPTTSNRLPSANREFRNQDPTNNSEV